MQARNTRQRIAYLLWKGSTNHPRPLRPTSARPRRETRQNISSSALSMKLHADHLLPRASLRQKRPRSNKNEGIMLERSRPHSIVRTRDAEPTNQLTTIVKRKRFAATSDASTLQPTQRHAPKRRSPPNATSIKHVLPLNSQLLQERLSCCVPTLLAKYHAKIQLLVDLI